MRRASRRCVGAVLALLVLAGCQDADLDALQARLETLRNKPRGEIAELPEMPYYTVAAYHGAARRSPFVADDGEAEVAAVEQAPLPDADRPRQPLEAYELDDLELVGTLSVGQTPSGLVRAPDGRIHRLFIGDYLGRDRGRVVDVGRRSLSLMETVRDQQGGWTQRPQRLEMAKQ